MYIRLDWSFENEERGEFYKTVIDRCSAQEDTVPSGVTGICFNLTLYILEQYMGGYPGDFSAVCLEILHHGNTKKEEVIRDLAIGLGKYLAAYGDPNYAGKQTDIINKTIQDCEYEHLNAKAVCRERITMADASAQISQLLQDNKHVRVLVCENKGNNSGHTVGIVREGDEFFYFDPARALHGGYILANSQDNPGVRLPQNTFFKIAPRKSIYCETTEHFCEDMLKDVNTVTYFAWIGSPSRTPCCLVM